MALAAVMAAAGWATVEAGGEGEVADAAVVGCIRPVAPAGAAAG